MFVPLYRSSQTLSVSQSPCSLVLDVFFSCIIPITAHFLMNLSLLWFSPFKCSHIPKEYDIHQAYDFQNCPSPFGEHHCNLFIQSIFLPYNFSSFRDFASLEYHYTYNWLCNDSPIAFNELHSQSLFIIHLQILLLTMWYFHCSFHLKFNRDVLGWLILPSWGRVAYSRLPHAPGLFSG